MSQGISRYLALRQKVPRHEYHTHSEISRAMTTQKIPKEPKGWAKLAEQHGVLHQNIHDLDVLDSASKIKDKQFYALRVLWQQHKLFPSESEFCDREVLKEAESFLSKWPSWNAYLENIKASAGSSSLSTIDDIGAFSSARYYQMRTYSSPLTHDVGPVLPKIVPSPSPIAHRTRRNRPTPASSGYPLTPTPMSRSQKEKQPLSMTELNSPLTEIEEYPSELMQDFNVALYPESPANPAESLPSEDEQIVNTALMLFLDNVTIYHPNVKAEGSSSPRWTMKRLQLKCGSWEARTDGFLRMGSDGSKVRAILETKPHVRTRSLDAIQKQESAQMAAWICQSPNGNFSVSGKESPYFR